LSTSREKMLGTFLQACLSFPTACGAEELLNLQTIKTKNQKNRLSNESFS
jgi:hypothetical protein